MVRIQEFKGFFKGYLEASLALLTGFIDLFAGLFAVKILGFSKIIPWVLVAYPPLLSGRGAIAGVSSGNMTTMLHLGSMRPSIRNNTPEFYSLISSVIVTSFLVSLYTTSLISISIIILFKSVYLTMLLLVVISAFVISVFISIFITALFASLSFTVGLDPDLVTYPIISSINDVIISAIYYFFIILSLKGIFRTILIIFAIIIVFLVAYLVYEYYDDILFKQTVKEAFSAGILAVSIASISGHFLKSVENVLIAYPEALIILPTILTCLGDQGSMYSSRTTTRLHRGTIEPIISSYFETENLTNIFIILFAGMTIFTVYGAIGVLSSGNVNRMLPFILALYIVNLIGAFIVSFLGFVIAITSFNYSMNPDNFAIPLVTTLTDLFFTIILVSVVSFIYSLFGV